MILSGISRGALCCKVGNNMHKTVMLFHTIKLYGFIGYSRIQNSPKCILDIPEATVGNNKHRISILPHAVYLRISQHILGATYIGYLVYTTTM